MPEQSKEDVSKVSVADKQWTVNNSTWIPLRDETPM